VKSATWNKKCCTNFSILANITTTHILHFSAWVAKFTPLTRHRWRAISRSIQATGVGLKPLSPFSNGTHSGGFWGEKHILRHKTQTNLPSKNDSSRKTVITLHAYMRRLAAVIFVLSFFFNFLYFHCRGLEIHPTFACSYRPRMCVLL